MQTSITKIYNFEAAHHLPGHNGKCARLHGHSYKLEVTVTAPLQTHGSSEGMVLDFSDLNVVVEREVIQQWDHQFLNDLLPFRTTAENLAQEIFQRLSRADLNVVKIRLWETAKAFVTVTK